MKGTSTFLLTCVIVLTIQQQSASATSATDLFSCAVNVTDFPVNIEKLSGIWYEALRIPEVDVPECVSANAPNATTADDNYELEINFMNNANKKWKNTTETLVFPWTTEASKGVFNLHYGSGINTITFTYKIIQTDYTRFAAVCGYSSIATKVSFFKILTRERRISDDLRKQIDKQIDGLVERFGGEDASYYWIDQSARCSAARALPYLTVVFAIIFAFIFGK